MCYGQQLIINWTNTQLPATPARGPHVNSGDATKLYIASPGVKNPHYLLHIFALKRQQDYQTISSWYTRILKYALHATKRPWAYM